MPTGLKNIETVGVWKIKQLKTKIRADLTNF
jgi:hypothetical protein